MSQTRSILATKQEAQAKDPRSLKVLVGLDGFVDELVHVVRSREDVNSYTQIESISELAQRLAEAAGLSTNLELVPFHKKLGGNGPIMANALAAVGNQVTYVGSLGYPEIDPVFAELAEKAKVYSIASPGHTDALEFKDGKVMLGKVEPCKEVTWERLLEVVGEESLVSLFSEADLVAWVDWTMLPYATEVWRNLAQKILPQIGDSQPLVFFDLCDPAKRRESELVEALEVIQSFSSHSRPILGLNRKEATHVAQALGISPDERNLVETTEAIAQRLGIYGLVVHPTQDAAAVVNRESAYVRGAYTPNPYITTGAGDNFNAGFCLGLALGLGVEQSLYMGKGVAGFYVRHGRSPAWPELLRFFSTWAEKAEVEF